MLGTTSAVDCVPSVNVYVPAGSGGVMHTALGLPQSSVHTVPPLSRHDARVVIVIDVPFTVTSQLATISSVQLLLRHANEPTSISTGWSAG